MHLFPTPAALAAYCRTNTDHDLADHPVWPVVTRLDAADLTPDDDHRFDLDGVYDIAAENPDRWAVEELAATIDIVSRLAECLDTTPTSRRRGARRRRRPRASSRPSPNWPPSPRSAPSAWASRPSSAVPARTPGSASAGSSTTSGRTSSRSCPSTSTGPAPARSTLEDYPAASEVEDSTPDGPAREDVELVDDDEPGVRTIARGGRIAASPAEVAEAGKFWESVGILPVEIVVPEGAGVTLRCYVEDVARFLGRNGEVFLFDTPADLARFVKGNEEHDLMEIASWAEVADTDVPPLPADQDRYDLTELSEVLGEVADGAAGLVGPQRLRAAGRGRPRPRRVRRADPRRGAAVAPVAAGPGDRPRRERAQRDAARRGRRPAAPAVGRSGRLVSGALVFRD